MTALRLIRVLDVRKMYVSAPDSARVNLRAKIGARLVLTRQAGGLPRRPYRARSLRDPLRYPG